MIDSLLQVSLAAVVSLLILREVFNYLSKRREAPAGVGRGRSDTDKVKNVQNSVDAVLSRLDRIIERLEDLGDSLRVTKKCTQINCEQTDKLCRQMTSLEETVAEAVSRRRSTDTQPAIG